MRRFLPGPAAALASLLALPSPVLAASRGPEPEEEEDLVIIEDEMEGEEPAPEEPKPAEGPSELDSLLGEDEAEAKATAQVGAGPKEKKKDESLSESEEALIKTETRLITVVQRIRFLKKNRFDLQPQVGISVNDPYVRHYALGAELNYWITNRMAVGITGTGFIGAKTPRYDNIRFQEGILLTANKVLWQASANFLYNPFYGKISIFNRFLMHWEGYVQLGGGGIQTKVIPRFESLHDPFTNITGQGNFTIGSRFYTPNLDWLSVNFGVRTFIYPDKLEPALRGPDTEQQGGDDIADYDDPETAKDNANDVLGFHTMLFLGVSFYLPSTFEYTTRR
jgi:outer membrane beta-barrel protein